MDASEEARKAGHFKKAPSTNLPRNGPWKPKSLSQFTDGLYLAIKWLLTARVPEGHQPLFSMYDQYTVRLC
jgi:hypothetical protein